jgi:hypothetical protein
MYPMAMFGLLMRYNLLARNDEDRISLYHRC